MENYPNSFNGFIGNETSINKIQTYISSILSNNAVQHSQILLQGKSGTGKTFLIDIMAKYFEVPLLKITPEEVSNQEGLSHLKQILNSIPIGSTSKHKIILIEDLQDYDKKTKIQYNLMSAIPPLTNNPLIFTYTDDVYFLPKSFKDSSLVCKLAKPGVNALYQYLKYVVKQKNIELSDDRIFEVAKYAPSVCSAINSLYSCFVNKRYTTKLNIWNNFYALKSHKLLEDIDSKSLNIFALNTNDIPTINYMSHIIHKAEYFNFKRDTDKYLLNNVNLKFNNRLTNMKTMQYNTPSADTIELSKQLHVSTRILNQDYKFLLQNQSPKRKKASSITKRSKPKPQSKSLSKFF